ncbi:YCF48-related protein [Zunongwangia endophytica]|uniref:WD40/YVTN/BNR-like repeat-containing protein n=1 Tax=Zunongwangia endophytica TaxID=1808945 RepID=A0ABV8HEA5_9FLAO|nr:YCF48-related protein [Zunongwangia endophytica]MDN3594669.1 YCF48-related protein [Zunongwangia endophytica]
MKIVAILVCLLLGLQSLAQESYKPVSEIPDLEIDTMTVSFAKQYNFENEVSGRNVNVLHALENTGFQFYNTLSFKNDNEGIIAGGTRLRLRSTEDGGKHWNSFSFSRFANAFYSTTIHNNQYFVVGASRYILKNDNLDEEWKAFDVSSLAENKYALRYPKFYKIKFSTSGLGFIIGENDGKPIILKTINNGENWQQVSINGLEADKNLSDLFIFSDNTIMIVTSEGNVYQSTNEAKDWNLLYKGEEGASLNSIAFKNKNEGYISGLQGLLLKTKDGGKTWNRINTEVLKSRPNISNLEYTKNETLLLTTAASFSNQQDSAPIFSIDKEGKITPFMTSKKQTFAGDAYGLFLLKDNVFLLDRDKLYKTDLK